MHIRVTGGVRGIIPSYRPAGPNALSKLCIFHKAKLIYKSSNSHQPSNPITRWTGALIWVWVWYSASPTPIWFQKPPERARNLDKNNPTTRGRTIPHRSFMEHRMKKKQNYLLPCFSKWYMEGKQIAETNVFETWSGQVSVPRTELCMSDNSERACWATWYLWKLAKTAKKLNSIMVILDCWANLDEQMLSYMCNICETVKQQLGGQDECNSKAGNCAIARRAKWNSTLELLRDSGHCHLCNNPKLGFKSTASKFKQL